MSDTINVLCLHRFPGLRTFTDGKAYAARRVAYRLYAVTDDLGRERYIFPGEPCPHLWDGKDARLMGRWVRLLDRQLKDHS